MPAYDPMHGVYGPDSVIRRRPTIASHRNRPALQGEQPALPRVQNAASQDPNPNPWVILNALMSPEVFDELVDRVALRIERRVLDELERRGERNVPGVF